MTLEANGGIGAWSSPWNSAAWQSVSAQASDRFDPVISEADGDRLGFDIDAAATRTSDEITRNRRTEWSASTEVSVSIDGQPVTTVPVAFQASMPVAEATPPAMRSLNPFEPATLPNSTTVTLHGGDFVGTPFEAAFRELATANGVDDIADLQVVIAKDREGLTRVMSGSAEVFNAPKQHGPSSAVLDRQDFSVHTTLLRNGDAGQLAGFREMLVNGRLPDGTVGVHELTGVSEILGMVVDTASGETNEVLWSYDNQGRPVAAEATLTWEPGSRGRDSDKIEADAQSTFRKDKELAGSGDHVGHIFAYRFVNGHGAINMFPQDGNFNTGAYVKLENEWSDWLSAGMDIQISIRLLPEGVDRPDQVVVDYEVIHPDDGEVIYDPRVTIFDNEAGQVFDRVSRSKIADLIARAEAD